MHSPGSKDWPNARQARLNGFILKEDGPEELDYAIRTILRGGFYTPPSMSSELLIPSLRTDPIESLTPREKSELILCAQGYTMKDIANTLNISVKTAETHRNNIGRKLGHPNHTLACWTHSLAGSCCRVILIGVSSSSAALLDRVSLSGVMSI